MILQGTYYLRLKIGQDDLFVSTGNLYTLQVFQSLDRLVPYIKFELQDNGGVLTQLSVGDANDSTIVIGFKEVGADIADEYKFKIIKRDAVGNPTDSVFSIYAILDSSKLYKPSYSRGYVNSTINNILNKIASETGVDEIWTDLTINRRFNIVQPNKSNAWFLNYLSMILYGDSGETSYFINYILDDGKVKLRCVSLNYLLTQPVKRKFILSDNPYQDAMPILDYEFVENATALSMLGTGSQRYRYFDFNNGEYKNSTISINDSGLLSLTPYLLVESNDTLSGNDYILGRDTSLLNAAYMAKARYKKKLMSLSQVWITVYGDSSLLPGDIVEIDCLRGLLSENPKIWRISGKWLIRRVIHILDTNMKTRLLLTRSGIETDAKAGLVEGRRAV